LTTEGNLGWLSKYLNQAMGWTTTARFPTGARNLSLHHHVQTVSGAHPISYPKGTEGFFPGRKVAEA